jgi:hypothetical protein
MATTQPPHPWIAELRVILVHPDGRRVHGHIAIGQPYTLAGGDPAASHESRCAIEIDGLHSRNHPIIGGGSLQALLLAIDFLRTRLHDFVSCGGRVLDAEDESDLPLAALFGSIST